MSDLKPCPFCDAEPTQVSRPIGDFTSYWIECEECGMRGPSSLRRAVADDRWSDLPRKGDEWQAHVKQADGTERPFTLTDLDAAVDAVSSPQDRPAEHDITRRDRFAMLAVKALLSVSEYAGSFPDGLASDAVRVADALIEELAKKGEDDD